MAEGIIIKALSGFYYVDCAEGRFECRARGRFRIEKTTPLVGDRVEFSPTEPGKGFLTSIFPRKNEFIRPPIANIDRMVIVASAAIPVTDPFLVDKMTVIAGKNDCESIICINKCDLVPAERLYDIYSAAGFTTIVTSAETGEGSSALREAIKGGICVLTGNSGVGKSSILNMLEPDFRLSVGEISNKLGRGRHTTRHVELYKLSCGATVADTPGFSAFDARQFISREDLQYLFPDFEKFIGGCRFPDCAHIKEPGCAILKALETNELQRSRHNSYVRLYNQESGNNTWEHGTGVRS